MPEAEDFKLVQDEDEEASSAEDQTSEEKKNEGDPEGDTAKKEEKKEEKKEKPTYDRAEVAQKAKWRARAQAAEARIKALEGTSGKGKPLDDKEAAAQKYIRDQARAAFEEMKKAEEDEKAKKIADFETKVDDVLDDNPDITERQLRDVIEDYEVEPKAAVRIIKRMNETGEKKPNLPKPKRASTTPAKKAVDDKDKSFWQIAQEVARDYQNEKA